MDFGEVLSKAWKITWKFKVLWVFGIFASCGTRSGPNFNFNNSYRTSAPLGQTPALPPGFEDNLFRLVHFFENPAVVATFISLICVLILLTIFFSIIGRVGLIKGAMDADGGAERLGFGELWKSGLQYFWRMFLLSLLIGSPILLIYLALLVGVIVFAVYASGTQGYSSSAAAPGILVLVTVLCSFACVVFLLAIVISFLSPQAERAIVIENHGVISGLRRGWNVLTSNLGSILIVWIITVAIGFVAGIVIALPVLVVVIPAVFAFVASGSHASYTPLIVAGLCILAYIPVSLVANGILMTYIQSVWTLTYIRLTKPKQDAGTPVISPANA
jgi:hypothetical protein